MNFSLLSFFKKRKLFAIFVFISSLIASILPLSAKAWWWDFNIVEATATAVANAIITIIFTILTAITAPFLELAQQIFMWVTSDAFIRVSFTGPDNLIVQEGWKMMRNFSMSFIILGLVYIGLATALNLANFKTKQTLFRIIVVALLINFTPVLCGIIIDGANVVTKILLPEDTALLGGIADKMGTQFNVLMEASTGTPAAALAKGLLLTTFNLVATFIFLTFAALFAIRYVVLWLLVIVSPLAFLLWVFPFGQQYFQKWWKEFINWSIIGIPAALVVYLSAKLVNVTVSRPTTDMMNSNLLRSGGGTNSATIIAQYSVPMIFLVVGFIFTLQVSAMGSGIVMNQAKKISGKAKAFGGRTLKRGFKAGGIGAVRRTTGAIVGVKQGAIEGRQMRKSGDGSFGAGTGHAITGGFKGAFTQTGVARGEEAIEKMSMSKGRFGGYAQRLTGRGISRITTTSRGKTFQAKMEKAKNQSTATNVSRFNSAINSSSRLAIVASEIKDGNFQEFKKNADLGENEVLKLYETAQRTKGNKAAKETAQAMEELYAEELGEKFGQIAQETGAYTEEQQANDRAEKGYNNYTDRIVDRAKSTDAIKRLTSSIDSLDIQNSVRDFWDGNQLSKAAETMGSKFTNAMQKSAPSNPLKFYTEINNNTGQPRNLNALSYRRSTAAKKSGIGLSETISSEDYQKAVDKSLKKANKIVNGQTLSARRQEKARAKGGFIRSESPPKERKESFSGPNKIKSNRKKLERELKKRDKKRNERRL